MEQLTEHVSAQTFNKGLFDYLIAADTQAAGLGVHEPRPWDVADAAPAKDRGDKRRKRKREGAADDAEYGVSRGIDFRGVSTVINVDCPTETSKWVPLHLKYPMQSLQSAADIRII